MFIESCSHRHDSPADLRTIHDRILWTLRHDDADKALEDVNRALERVAGKSLEWTWRLKVLRAQILLYKSNYQEALSSLREPLPASLASTDIVVRKAMMEGIAHRQGQQFAESQKKIMEADRLARASHGELLGEVLNARGALEVDEEKFSEGQQTFEQALTLARQQRDSNLEASVLNNLARVAMSKEHFGEALDRAHVALELSRSLGLRPLVATILGNMGWGYFELGDFENSLDYYKQGAEASSKSGLAGYSAYWFTAVATSYLALHEYTLAEDLARNTLEHARRLKNAQTTTLCFNTLAEIMLHTGRLAEAERYNDEAMGIESAGDDKFGKLDSLLMAGHIAETQKRFPDAENFFQQILADSTAETPRLWEAEAGLAGVRDDEGKPLEADHLYRQAIATIEKARQSVNHDELRMSFLSGGIAVYGEYVDFLIRRGRPNDALKLAEFSRARTLEEGLTVGGKRASETRRERPPQELARKLKATLMFYWIGERNSYLWVIAPGKTNAFKLVRAAEIEPVVKSYRKAILGMRDAQDAAASDGKKLYALLVEPAKKLIPKGSRVILLPAESLYGLNFETLVVSEPQPHFWIEDVTLTTANSLTLLASAVTRPAAKGENLLLVGNTEPNASFPALAQAPVEIQKVERYFPDQNRKVLEGKSATPTAYLSSSPEKFAYLHFVTHGTASITRPLESAVILSSEGDSYKLYARDIVKHRLNAHLVTISACDGLGKRTYSGEGLVGLSWAFLRAGAHNVIGALWEVSDASTPQLMDAIYNGLSQGKDPATALRDAKLSLLHANSDTVFKKPFYWAPFQLYAGS